MNGPFRGAGEENAGHCTGDQADVHKALANIVALGPGVHRIKSDRDGRLQSCVIVGQSRVSTVLGTAKGIQTARTRARRSYRNGLTWTCYLQRPEHDIPGWVAGMMEQYKLSGARWWEDLQRHEAYTTSGNDLQMTIEQTIDRINLVGWISQPPEKWFVFARHNKLRTAHPPDVKFPDHHYATTCAVFEGPEVCGMKSAGELLQAALRYKAERDDLLVTLWAVADTSQCVVPLGALIGSNEHL